MDLKQLCACMILLISLTTSVFSLGNFGCGKLPANIYEKGINRVESITSPWHAIVSGPMDPLQHATLISQNLVIFSGLFTGWPSKNCTDVKQYSVRLGISYHERKFVSYTHEINVSRLSFKPLRFRDSDDLFLLTILVLSEPVSISEYIMPVCVDWQMQYHLKDRDNLQYEGMMTTFLPDDVRFKMLRGPTKCIGRYKCTQKFADSFYLSDIGKDTICCEKPEWPPSNYDILPDGSAITSEHFGLRFLKAIMLYHRTEKEPYYSFTDISLHIPWIQRVYKKNTVTCPPMISDSLDILCINDGEEKNCSSESLPGTKLTASCKVLHTLPNGKADESIEMSCLTNGKWSDQLYDCVPVTCPPMISDSLQIQCINDGEEKDCSSESLPGTTLTASCKFLYKLPNGNDDESIEMACLTNGEWSDQLYDCEPVMCPPVISHSIEIKCAFEGKETDCSNYSRPGTTLIPRCEPLYRLQNSTDEKSFGLSCLPNGKWSDQLYDCKPDFTKLGKHDNSTYPDTKFFMRLVLIITNVKEKIQFQIQPISSIVV